MAAPRDGLTIKWNPYWPDDFLGVLQGIGQGVAFLYTRPTFCAYPYPHVSTAILPTWLKCLRREEELALPWVPCPGQPWAPGNLCPSMSGE